MDQETKETGEQAQPGADLPMLAFIHVPKTGGTSLEGVFQENDWPMFNIRHPDQARAFLSLPPEAQERYRGVYGHMPFGIDQYVQRPVTYITFLRDPVERTLSAYAHNLQNPDEPGADAVRAQGLAWTAQASNYMCRFLANHTLVENPDDQGEFWWTHAPPDFAPRAFLDQAKAHLDRCAFVGLTEHYEDDVRALRDLQNHPIHVPAAVPHRKTSQGRIKQSDLSRDQIEAIRAANHLDIELYDYALSLRRRWGGPLCVDSAQTAPRVAAPATDAMGPGWRATDLGWRRLPGWIETGPTPQTFIMPDAPYVYGAATRLLWARDCILRVRARVNAGSVSMLLTSADGAAQLTEETVLAAEDGRVTVSFRITPQMAPAILVLRGCAEGYVRGDPPGSVEIEAAEYGPPDALTAAKLGLQREGLMGQVKRLFAANRKA